MIKLDDSSELNILNMLVDHKILTSQQFKQIETLSEEGGKSKLITAFELNLTNSATIQKVLSESYSLPSIELKKIVITDQIRKVASLRYLKENIIIPFEITGEVVKLAITDASKLGLIKNIKNLTQLNPELYAASLDEIENFRQRLENKKSVENLKNKKLEQDNKKEKNVPVEVESDVIAFGDNVIKEAISLEASDIHIEPFKNTCQVRFRIDGVLKTMDKFTKFLAQKYNAVVTSIKIISILDIA